MRVYHLSEFTSLTEAVQRIPAGQLLVISSGTYVLPNPLIITKSIRISGSPDSGQLPVIRLPRVYINRADDVIIEGVGFDMVGFGMNESSLITIARCALVNGGFHLANTSRVSIVASSINRAKHAIVVHRGRCKDVELLGCVFKNIESDVFLNQTQYPIRFDPPL